MISDLKKMIDETRSEHWNKPLVIAIVPKHKIPAIIKRYVHVAS